MEIDADETGARAAEPRTTTEVEPAVAATISEEATSPTADADQREESPTGDKARPSSPTPTPPHCLGARGYDEGFCDVGSFFVYQHELRQQQQVVQGNGMMDLELFGAAPPPTQQAPTHLLQYKLIDGLRIKYAAAVGGANEVEGNGLEVAGRTFLLLQRQVDSMRRALVSVADSRSPATGPADPAENDEEEEGDNNTDATANGGGGGAAAAANGKRKQQRPHQAREDLFALSNTEDNESLQGLVRSRGSLWIGKFGLPPTPAGEDESKLVDIWPRKVARFVEDGGGGSFPLEGKPNTFGSLTAPEEGSASRGGAVECARRAQRLIAQALAELRPHVPTPKEEEGEEVDNNPAYSLHWSPSLKPGRGGKAGGSVVGSGGGSSGSPKAAAAVTAPGKVKPVPMSAGDSEEEDTEEEKSGAAAGQGTAAAGGAGGRRGRKRQRVKGEEVAEDSGGAGAGASYRLRGREASNGVEDMDDDSDDDDDEGGAESRGGNAGGPAGAGEMTVAAVRESLLSNPSEEGEPGPSPQEWEVAVKKFISHVESLPPGTEQEELSLMFAAALDPTLVRLRMANTKLIGLAEACLPQGEGEVPGNDDEEDSDSPNGGGAGKGGTKKSGFKVRLELEAPEEGAPPPDGIAGVLRAVAAAAAAVEAAARAEACVICGGDTLGGLGEIKRDYKRCLPPGPREPLQFIIAEEEARVEGYVGAHQQVLRDAGETFQEVGPEVGRAYRAVEREAGWSGVRDQVDAFLIEFEDYCASLMPAPLSTTRSILGVDLAAARRAAAAAAAAHAGGAAPAGSATKPVKAA
ncbi:unnamed protein product [Ectocarpus sp. CCAP 1310/34]|nr:unnamed protein product [Ectocarpus sp. CCAP 1310/34]